MRCNNCGRHVENHEKMFRRPVKSTIGKITTRRVELVCDDCLPEIDIEMTEYKQIMRKSVLMTVIMIVGGLIINSIIAFFVIKSF